MRRMLWNAVEIGLPTREETFENRPHIVVPVIALVEGVHMGSKGPAYYPAEEIATHVEAWNGVPLPVRHPEKDGEPLSANTPELIEKQSIGQGFNFHIEDAKLKGELWIDKAKAQKLAPEVLSIIYSDRHLEVSTGLWSDDDETPGEWEGEKYDGTVRNFVPDHLALLPGGEGACNYADGCGVRVNKGGAMDKVRALFRSLGESLGITEASLDDVQSSVSAAVRALNDGKWEHWAQDTYDDHVVYEKRWVSEDAAKPPKNQPALQLYQQSYTIGDDGAAVLSDDAVEVKLERKYVPVTAAADGNEEEETMANEKLVAELIDCERTKFTDQDKEWLGKMEDDQLEKMKVDEPEVPTETEEEKAAREIAEKEAADKKAAETTEKPAEGADTIPTTEEYIDGAPPEIAANLRRALARDRAVKTKLVEALIGNDRNTFSKEDLEAKEIDELQRLTELGRVEVDFSGQAGAEPTANDDDPPPMPSTLERIKANA